VRSKAQDTGVRRGEGRQRLRPLRTGNSPKVGRKVGKAQEGEQSSSDRLKKKKWTIGFYFQEEIKRSLQKGEIESRWISFRNPVSRQIGQELHEVYHREKPR
jgi:hypothetical protein